MYLILISNTGLWLTLVVVGITVHSNADLVKNVSLSEYPYNNYQNEHDLQLINEVTRLLLYLKHFQYSTLE